MNRLFNIFKKKHIQANKPYVEPELLPIEVLMKYNTDPFKRYDMVLKSSVEGGRILGLVYKLQDKWHVTEEEIQKAFHTFASQQHSNAVSITQLYFAVLAQLSYYRNEIVPALLIYPMRSFYYATGSTDYAELVKFIHDNLIDYKITPYGGLPPHGEMNWFTAHITQSKSLIEKIFQQLILENKEAHN